MPFEERRAFASPTGAVLNLLVKKVAEPARARRHGYRSAVEDLTLVLVERCVEPHGSRVKESPAGEGVAENETARFVLVCMTSTLHPGFRSSVLARSRAMTSQNGVEAVGLHQRSAPGRLSLAKGIDRSGCGRGRASFENASSTK